MYSFIFAVSNGNGMPVAESHQHYGRELVNSDAQTVCFCKMLYALIVYRIPYAEWPFNARNVKFKR